MIHFFFVNLHNQKGADTLDLTAAVATDVLLSMIFKRLS